MGALRLTRVDPTLPCTAVALRPEWALEETARRAGAAQRSLTGRLATVHWSTVAEFRVPLKSVAGDEAAALQAWWTAGAPVAFTLDTSEARSTVVCRIANAQQPLAQREQPDAARWAGILELAALRAGGRAGQPFILDDPVSGRLDQSAFTLVD
jgi:hypothetical protein